MADAPAGHQALIGLALLLSLVAAGAVAAPAAPQVKASKVTIEGMRFEPETLTVQRGERVVWVNKDLVPHTVTSAAFDSRVIAPNGSWSFVAKKPGRYEYVCKLHPTMKATLIVP